MRSKLTSPLLCASLLLAGGVLSHAVPVTFQLNMSYQYSIGAFNPDTDQLTVRGTFNGWDPSAPMTPVGGQPYLYAVTVDVGAAAGSIAEYKFVLGDNNWESTPNRYYPVPAAAATVGEAFFNNQWAGGPDVNVTFRVNMSAQAGAGNFDPATDSVQVRGGFEGWSGLAMTPTTGDAAIYEGTWTSGAHPPGTQFQYKFVFIRGGNVTWESRGNVPYGNDANRLVVLTGADQTEPTVYFNDVSGFPIKAAAAYEVNVGAMTVTGAFDPATDEVWVRGNAMGWDTPNAGQGFQLFEDTTRPGIYTNIYKMDSRLTGEVLEFKYVLWRPATFSTTWEGGANKSLVWNGTEPTTADGYHLRSHSGLFDNLSPSDFLAEDTYVTFRVNMNGAVGVGGDPVFNPGDPSYHWLSLNGPFRNNGEWGPWNGGLPLMFDDGFDADEVAGDGIYSEKILFPRGSAVRVQYKYGINGLDNEAPAFNDHVRYIRALGDYVMPVDTFGVIVVEADPGTLTITRTSPTQVTLTWNGRPGLRLQSASSLAPGDFADVPGTDGQSSSTQTIGAGNQYFRLSKL